MIDFDVVDKKVNDKIDDWSKNKRIAFLAQEAKDEANNMIIDGIDARRKALEMSVSLLKEGSDEWTYVNGVLDQLRTVRANVYNGALTETLKDTTEDKNHRSISTLGVNAPNVFINGMPMVTDGSNRSVSEIGVGDKLYKGTVIC